MPLKSIVTTGDRPDLVPIVAEWLWHAFWRQYGYSLEGITERVAESISSTILPRCLILLIDGAPVGTASLIASDLDIRSELSPWLAGMYVHAAARGNGYARDLIRAVEHAAQLSSFQTLWLYTHTAEGLYASNGWQTVETLRLGATSSALMRRDLCPGAAT